MGYREVGREKNQEKCGCTLTLPLVARVRYPSVVSVLALFVVGGCLGREGRGALGGRGTQFVHGYSRMTIDPHIPTVPGTENTSGFRQPGRHRGGGVMPVGFRRQRMLSRSTVEGVRL